MHKIILILFVLPFFASASFPIISSLQINDTIINSENPVNIQVDSLSKYPIGNETLSEYKERLKRNGFEQSQNKHPITWKRVVKIFFTSLLLLLVIFSIAFFANSDGWDLGLFNTNI